MSSLVNDNQEAVETVRELIKGIDTAMLTTMTDQGLVSRPMKTQEVEFDGDVWFLTKKDTDKYNEILNNPNVNIAYVGKSFVSIRGTAEVVEDTNKKKQFWNIAYEKLLQTSYDDPNVVLIKIIADTAEYWETGNMTKKVASLFKRITGQESDSTDINRTVELN